MAAIGPLSRIAGFGASRGLRAAVLACATSLLLLLAPLGALAEDVVHEHLGLGLNGHLEVARGKSLEKDGVALILHGTLAHNGMETIRDLQDNLKNRGINTLAVTLSLGLDRRTGMFDCTLEHDHRHSDAVDELNAWMDWLGARKAAWVDIIGHSRGGAQVALFAAKEADKVSGRVVLVASPLEAALGEEVASQYEAQFGAPLAPLLDEARRRAGSDTADTLLEVPGFLYCRNARVSPATLLDYYASERRSVPELLKAIKAPTLVIAAGEDEIVPDLMEKLKDAGVPEQIKLSEVDGADHFFRDLFGEDLADEIAAFLKRD